MIVDLAPKIEELERDFQLSSEALALILEVNPRTVARWHNGTTPERRALRRLDVRWSLRSRALEMFSNREEIWQWLHAQSAYLGWLTPAEVLRAGRIDRMHSDLDGLAGRHVPVA